MEYFINPLHLFIPNDYGFSIICDWGLIET